MSFTLNYTGDEINAILARANNGGEIDDELALKAPLASPALTGTPTAPTQAEGDDSTKIATTEYADRAADAAGAAAEAAAKEYTDAATAALYIIDTASGSIASFSDGADGIPMRSVKAAITPVQSGSGAPSPDNVRPISGWTGAEVVRTGKNLLEVTASSKTQAGVTFTVNDDGTVTVSGTATGVATLNFNGHIPLKPVPVILSGLENTSNLVWNTFTVYDMDGNALGTPITTGQGQNAQAQTIDLSVYPTISYGLIGIKRGGNTVTSGIVRPMLRLASDSDATFEPYAGQTFPVTWESQAGEVFGGTIDAVSGELKVTHDVFNFSTSSGWAYRGNGIFSRVITGRVYVRDVAAVWCNEYPVYAVSGYGSAVVDAFSIYSGVSVDDAMYIRPEGGTLTSLDELNTWLSANPLQVVWQRLSASQTYLLSVQQIASLYGSNNVWSNTGDTEVTYVADPKLYIAKITGVGTLTLGSVSPLSANRPVAISEEDLEQADEVSEAVEAAAEALLPAESGETEEGAQE